MVQFINKKLNYLKIKTIIVVGVFLVSVCLSIFGGAIIDEFSSLQFVSSAIAAPSQSDPNSELSQGIAVLEEPLGMPKTDIRLVVANVIRIALGLVGIILVAYLVYAGYLWMTAGGNDEQIGNAKKIIINAVIGLIIILSAYAIVYFVLRLLGVDEGINSNGNITAPASQNFYGSGSLGKIVKDHYPSRSQVDVPRNTKIIISFFKPIRMNEIVVDTNGNGILGDCLTTGLFNWETSCDKLQTSSDLINILQIIPSSTPGVVPTYQPIRGAAILAAPSTINGITGVFSIVIRPYDYLGNEITDTDYQVHLGNKILRDDIEGGNKPIFDGLPGAKFYEWNFTVSTELDLSPPYVTDVYPASSSIEFKNTVMQINFNEAMDPIGIQGSFALSADGSYYYLQNGFIYLKSGHSTVPQGSFNLVNNYRTLEFTPATPCGVNACGGTIFCMPVCDQVGATCKQDDYGIILKAANTISANTFEAIPFTGVADISGNALDGNKNLIINTAPFIEDSGVGFTGVKVPDNYWWNFILKDEMDLVPPIIAQVTPGPEAEWVGAKQPMGIYFDKRMRIEPMYSISINESPTPAERCQIFGLTGATCILDQIWSVPFVEFFIDSPKTKTNLNHGDFLDGLPQGYLPYISSAVQDVYFNCLYPGQGPKQVLPYVGDNKDSTYCDKNPANCCIQNETQVFCCNGSPVDNLTQPGECLDSLKVENISLPTI